MQTLLIQWTYEVEKNVNREWRNKQTGRRVALVPEQWWCKMTMTEGNLFNLFNPTPFILKITLVLWEISIFNVKNGFWKGRLYYGYTWVLANRSCITKINSFIFFETWNSTPKSGNYLDAYKLNLSKFDLFPGFIYNTKNKSKSLEFLVEKNMQGNKLQGTSNSLLKWVTFV